MGSPDQPLHDMLPVLAHDLKLREVRDRSRMDFERMVSEMARLLIGNLLLINAGGLGAIPAVAIFLGVQGWPAQQKITMFGPAGTSFAIGLLAALACGILGYLSYSASVRMSLDGTELESARLMQLTALSRDIPS